MFAVSIIRGIRLPFTTAVRVRTFSPYSLETSCPPVAYIPIFLAISATKVSFSGSSTLYASVATMTSAPSAFNSFIFVSAFLASAFASTVSRKVNTVFSSLPRARGILPILLTFLARSASIPLPIPKIPVVATSPSSSALVA